MKTTVVSKVSNFFKGLAFVISLIISVIVALSSFFMGFLILNVDENTINDWGLFTSWRPWYYELTGENLLRIHSLGFGFVFLAIIFMIIAMSIYSKTEKK